MCIYRNGGKKIKKKNTQKIKSWKVSEVAREKTQWMCFDSLLDAAGDFIREARRECEMQCQTPAGRASLT